MLTLTIFRHAKSAWDDPSLEDHERPLAARGEKAARTMGRFLVSESLVPDLVLCSTAMRTRQTLALALLEMPEKPGDIRFDDDLYLASPSTLRSRLTAASGDDTRHILLIGHNPGLHALALELVGAGRKRDIVSMAKKFPTAAVAVIDAPDAERFADLRPACGTLRLFRTPRDLA